MTASPVELTDIESLAGLFPAFEFERLIARGRTGAVYKARQRSLDRDVAIKILPAELASDPSFRDSFEAATKAMARLNHPNLVKVFDFGEMDGFLYIVMEYVPGKSLFHASQGLAIDSKQAVEILIGVCRGMGHAHEMGLIHRGLTPGNILLTLQCEPKVGDFGFGMQTIPYAAPEIAANPQSVDARSDVYALGMVLRELLIGASSGRGSSSPAFPDAALAAICGKATHADPAMRYPDVSLLAGSLKQWSAAKTTKPLHAGKPLLTSARPRPVGVRSLSTLPPGKKPSGTWQVLKNCAIIAFLLCSIHVTWGVYQKGRNGNLEISRQAPEKPKVKLAQVRQAPPEESSFQLARFGTEEYSAPVTSEDSSR
jgi:serine/threonine protein kinase